MGFAALRSCAARREAPHPFGAATNHPAEQQDVPGQESQTQPAADHGGQSYQGHGRLAGKAAVITGADSGIGRAVAIA